MPEQLPPPNPDEIVSYQTPVESQPWVANHAEIRASALRGNDAVEKPTEGQMASRQVSQELKDMAAEARANINEVHSTNKAYSDYDRLLDPKSDLTDLKVEDASVSRSNRTQDPVERQINLVKAESANKGDAIREIEESNEVLFAKYRKLYPDKDIPERMVAFANAMMEKREAQKRPDGGKDSIKFEAKAGEAIHGLPDGVFEDATRVLSNYQKIEALRRR